MRAQQILAKANLQSISALKEAPRQKLVFLILSRHYLAGMAAKELSSRLCSN
jgi:hypothetical protein